MAEDRVRRQVQLAGQRRMEVDPVSAVRPVIQERGRVEQRPGIVPGADMRPLLPPLGRHDLAIPVRRLVPGQAQVADRGHQRDQRGRKDGRASPVSISASKPPARAMPAALPRGSSDPDRFRRGPDRHRWFPGFVGDPVVVPLPGSDVTTARASASCMLVTSERGDIRLTSHHYRPESALQARRPSADVDLARWPSAGWSTIPRYQNCSDR